LLSPWPRATARTGGNSGSGPRCAPRFSPPAPSCRGFSWRSSPATTRWPRSRTRWCSIG